MKTKSILLTCLFALFASMTVSAQTIVKGDMNGDGAVNLKDVTLLRRYIAGGWSTVLDETAADLNGDGAMEIICAEASHATLHYSVHEIEGPDVRRVLNAAAH